MWSSNRRTFLSGAGAAVTAALGGCGFTPVYGPDGSGAALDGTVSVSTPNTSNGFTLRQSLQDSLGAATTPRYVLDVTTSTSEDRVAVTQDSDTKRYNVIGSATYTLTDAATGQTVTHGEVNSFTSYAATGTTVATLTSERDAYRRLMVILADAIVDRLLVALPKDTT